MNKSAIIKITPELGDHKYASLPRRCLQPIARESKTGRSFLFSCYEVKEYIHPNRKKYFTNELLRTVHIMLNLASFLVETKLKQFL